MVNQYLAPLLTRLGVLSSHPAAFVLLLWYVAAWLIFNPRSFDWQSVATVGTWLMTLFIQRAEHRDTQAIHAKLDEARTELTLLDQEEPEAVMQHRLNEQDRLSGCRIDATLEMRIIWGGSRARARRLLSSE